MPNIIYPLRLSPVERQHFGHAAKAEGMTLARWLRTAASARAQKLNRRPANLDYPEELQLSPEAEANPRKFIQKKLEARRELYR